MAAIKPRERDALVQALHAETDAEMATTKLQTVTTLFVFMISS